MKTDFSEYKGIEARVTSYVISHSLLILNLNPPIKSPLPKKFLLCHFCDMFPQSMKWTIDNIQIYVLEKHRCLVTDWKSHIYIPCGAVEIRDHFDLARYYGFEKRLKELE